MKWLLLSVALLLLPGRIAALGYVESSSGLNNPTLEGGRTELEFADINNDGNVDLLSIGDHGNPYVNTQEHGIMVWFGDGSGNWNVYQTGDFGYGGMAVGDVNNDGLLDIGYGMHHNYDTSDLGDSMVEVALGDGTGRNWTAWDNGLGPPSGTWGMFSTDFADLNNDGWLDLCCNTFGYGDGFRVYRNDHDGSWTQSFNAPTANSDMDIVFGDINNDGNADIAASNQYGTVWFGDGTGNFSLAQYNLPVPSSGGVSGVALGDIDNDGAKELAYCQAGDTIEIWKWNLAGDSWQSMRGDLPLSGYQAVQLCDMNGDGWLDLVGYGSAVGTVWLGDGTGHWTQAAGFTTPTYGDYQALRVGGDVDHNGRPDIVVVDDEGSYPSDHNVAHCFRETSVPETLRIHPEFPRGGENFVAGSVQFIDWTCGVPNPDTALVRLEFSYRGSGGPWLPVAAGIRNSGRYQWTVPDQPSNDCRIRYVASTRSGMDSVVTPASFTILPTTAVRTLPAAACLNPARLSVLPNPVRDRALVSSQFALSGPFRLTVQDALGRSRAEVTARIQSGLRHGLMLDTRSLSAGVYFVRLEAQGLVSTARFVVVR